MSCFSLVSSLRSPSPRRGERSLSPSPTGRSVGGRFSVSAFGRRVTLLRLGVLGLRISELRLGVWGSGP